MGGGGITKLQDTAHSPLCMQLPFYIYIYILLGLFWLNFNENEMYISSCVIYIRRCMYKKEN